MINISNGNVVITGSTPEICIDIYLLMMSIKQSQEDGSLPIEEFDEIIKDAFEHDPDPFIYFTKKLI